MDLKALIASTKNLLTQLRDEVLVSSQTSEPERVRVSREINTAVCLLEICESNLTQLKVEMAQAAIKVALGILFKLLLHR